MTMRITWIARPQRLMDRLSFCFIRAHQSIHIVDQSVRMEHRNFDAHEFVCLRYLNFHGRMLLYIPHIDLLLPTHFSHLTRRIFHTRKKNKNVKMKNALRMIKYSKTEWAVFFAGEIFSLGFCCSSLNARVDIVCGSPVFYVCMHNIYHLQVHKFPWLCFARSWPMIRR